MPKKILIFIIASILVSQMISLNTPQAFGQQPTSYTYTENFSATTYKDNDVTTAQWITQEHKVALKPKYIINNWSSYFNNFNGIPKAIANNNYIQMIGGGGGAKTSSLNLIPSGAFSSFEDKSNQLVGFNNASGLNPMIVAIDESSNWSNLYEGPYWLFGGGYFNGTERKLNKMQGNIFYDLSSDLLSLNFDTISDISCNNYQCLITSRNGKLISYNGKVFTDLSSNIDFNAIASDPKVSYNGSYWLVAGTRYMPSESSNYIGRIYKYDGSSFTKITEDNMFVGGGPSFFDIAWNGNYWLIVRGNSPIKVYKYDGATFSDLSSKFSNFITVNDIFSPSVYWTGNSWLINGGAYYRHLLRYDDNNSIVMDIFDFFSDFRSANIETIASQYQTTYNPFFIAGGTTVPILDLVNDYGYESTNIVQSKKINITAKKIIKATLTASQNMTGNMGIAYYLSADGGQHWTQVMPNSEYVFAYPGYDLRWKASLWTNATQNTPVISEIKIAYNTENDPSVISAVTVTSPNGGESLVRGTTHIIKWNHDSELAGKSNIEVSLHLLGPGEPFLIGSSASPGKDLLLYGPTKTNISSTIPSSAEYSWLVPTSISEGSYKIEVEEFDPATGMNHIDLSDLSFNIINSNTSSIAVTSPNGGETWQKGTTQAIKWSSSNLLTSGAVKISLLSSNSNEVRTIASAAPNSGSYFWTILNCTVSNPCSSNFEIPSGSYKIKVSNSDETISDESDNSFDIVSYTITPPPVIPPPSECFPDGTLIKLPNDPKVYVIISCKKKWIESAEEFNSKGYKWDKIEKVDSPVIQAYADYLEAKANLLRAIGQQKVYKIVNGKRIWVPTISAFNAQGLKWEDIKEVSGTEASQYPEAKLLKSANNQGVYYITDSGLKRHIPNPEVFNSYGNKWEDIVEVTDIELNAFENNELIKAIGDYKVYKLENGNKRWIKTAEAFDKNGYKWIRVSSINQTELNTYPEAAAIE